MKFLFGIFALLALSGCMNQVPAGHVGVKVYLAGSSKGVDHEALGVGRYYIGYNEQLFLFPTFQQNYVWTSSAHEGSRHDESIEFGAKGGIDVHANVGISFHIEPTKVAEVFQKYREGVDEIRETPLRNAVRDAFQVHGGTYSVEELYSDKEQLIEQVQNDVRKQFTPIGIIVDSISLVGNYKLPDTVTAALNAKIEATQLAQQKENEVASARADAQKAVAEAKGKSESIAALAKGEAEALLVKARAEAEANKLRSQTISESLIKLEMAKRWNGELPQVMGQSNGMMFSSDFLKGKGE